MKEKQTKGKDWIETSIYNCGRWGFIIFAYVLLSSLGEKESAWIFFPIAILKIIHQGVDGKKYSSGENKPKISFFDKKNLPKLGVRFLGDILIIAIILVAVESLNIILAVAVSVCFAVSSIINLSQYYPD